MNRTALVLAAHGSRNASADAIVRRCATEAGALGGFDEVAVAYHQGEPSFAAVLDQIEATRVTVVPFMTSRGYYSEVVLPRELARSPRSHVVRLRITDPIGTHATLAEVLADRIDALLRQFGLSPARTDVALVGHGTARHPRSRLATEELAGRLAESTRCRSSSAFFLDEDPGVEAILDRSTDSDVIVIPFLIGGGSHGSRDIPVRLGFVDRAIAPPECAIKGGRTVILDRALGSDPRMTEIVVALARGEGCSRPRAGRGQGAARKTGDSRSGHASRLRLGTRGSLLALWQARHVAARFLAIGVDVEIVEVSTMGDRVVDRPIEALPTSAPFADELERLLLDRRIDLAVHSYKDLAVQSKAGLEIAAVLPRGSVSESLVSFGSIRLADLPPGAVVGTCSSRRAAQLRAIRPDLRTECIRGPVDDRVRQVRAGKFDAAILATAGLERLGLLHEIAEQFPISQFVPAPAQGALAVQVRSDDERTAAACARLDDPAARRATDAELAVLRAFDRRDDFAVAAYATGSDRMTLHARAVSLDGRIFRDALVSECDPARLAERAIAQLANVHAELEVAV
ncbi:MAG: hydroxymethylbilane synthase [Planctomycetota bacterium]|nr:hydroxymethylbilane synthase [Planctomycetota bacterium]